MDRYSFDVELSHLHLHAGLSRRTKDARVPLAESLAKARRGGAMGLVRRSYQELEAMGARPRKVLHGGTVALTARKRRVAEMAAEGTGNREIAQALFVTVRTVESHLSHAYAKLGIASRTELAAALEG